MNRPGIPWSGTRSPRLRHLAPADPVGAGGIGRIVVTPDARAWAYTVVRRMSELYVVEGLRP